MIVAAGLGTRLRPLSELRPKPALPVRGIPVIGYTLELLAAADVREVVVNVHHLPEVLETTARAWCPEGVRLHFSREPELLHTGGAIRKVASFLGGSDPCLVIGGDMILDVDLRDLVARHRRAGRDATLLLRDDPRAPAFGTIGVAADGELRRVADRFDRGGEARSGVYAWVNVLSTRALETLPERDAFNHLDDWLAPQAERGLAVGAEVQSAGEGAWEPVGTLREYVDANFTSLDLSYLDVDARARQAGARVEDAWIAGPGAEIGAGARLDRVVVWDGERVPPGFQAQDGVFAGGRFHACAEAGGAAA